MSGLYILAVERQGNMLIEHRKSMFDSDDTYWLASEPPKFGCELRGYGPTRSAAIADLHQRRAKASANPELICA